MQAMLLQRPHAVLELCELPVPVPGADEILVRVQACGVCRTDLHLLDGELPQAHYPIIPGHQVVGTVAALGCAVRDLQIGERVGIPWLGWTCGVCAYCRQERENLCPEALFTGCQINGGFAEYCIVHHDYCLPLPPAYSSLQAAPLLCAGLIGYRAWSLCGAAENVGFFGFGASAHILTQVAVAQGKRIYAFTRSGDEAAQAFARRLGAVWAAAADTRPPQELDAAIIFAPAGELVPRALALVKPGGRVVCAGIHMSEIPAFSYELLWEERSLMSVANLTRRDGREFLQLASTMHIDTEVHAYPLAAANRALDDLRKGRFTGAAVLDLSQYLDTPLAAGSQEASE